MSGAHLPLAVLAAGLLVLGALFFQEAQAAVGVWIDSTAYGHCFFVIPISLFLAWERRGAIVATPIVPLPGVAVLALPMGVVWLAAERLGIMEGQQILALGFVELLFLAVLGWRMAWVLAVPLLYLAFLVPFGAFLTPALQGFTARFITTGLDMLGIANFTDGFVIEIPQGTFFVAEACAGLRFLIASIAFGVLYACMIYRSPGKRAAFIAASVVIPVIANGFRGLGIVVLGNVLGSAEAAAVDHVVYGWIFFSIVIVLLILVGLPFREDGQRFGPAVPVTPKAPAAGALWRTVAVVLALTAIAPVAAGLLDRQAQARPIVAEGLGEIKNCVAAVPGRVDGEGYAGWRYVCQDGRLGLVVTAFAPRGSPGALARVRRQQTEELSAEDATVRPLMDAGADAAWQLVSLTDPDRLIATAAWVDGRPATGGFAQRRLQAWVSVAGSTRATMLVTIAMPSGTARLTPAAREAGRQDILALLAANPDLTARIDALATRVAGSGVASGAGGT